MPSKVKLIGFWIAAAIALATVSATLVRPVLASGSCSTGWSPNNGYCACTCIDEGLYIYDLNKGSAWINGSPGNGAYTNLECVGQYSQARVQTKVKCYNDNGSATTLLGAWSSWQTQNSTLNSFVSCPSGFTAWYDYCQLQATCL